MYAITDLNAVLNTSTGLPLIEIYRQGTGSQTAASILLAFFALCFFGCLVANGNIAPLRIYRQLLTSTSNDLIPHNMGCIAGWSTPVLRYLDASSSDLQDAGECHAIIRDIHNC